MNIPIDELAQECNKVMTDADFDIWADATGVKKQFKMWLLKGGHPDKGGDQDIAAIMTNCVQMLIEDPNFATVMRPFDVKVGFVQMGLNLASYIVVTFVRPLLFFSVFLVTRSAQHYVLYQTYSWIIRLGIAIALMLSGRRPLPAWLKAYLPFKKSAAPKTSSKRPKHKSAPQSRKRSKPKSASKSRSRASSATKSRGK